MEWTSSANNGQTTQLEVVTIYRPTRVVAAMCCLICFLFLFISIFPLKWAETNSDGIVMKEGLFRICPRDGELPCVYQNQPFVKGCAALVILSFLMALAAGIMLIVGLLSRKEEIKYIVHRASLLACIVIAVLMLISLITFPTMLHIEINSSPIVSEWVVGWAYMLGWPAFVVIIVAIVLLILDPNPDETSIREKVVYSRE